MTRCQDDKDARIRILEEKLNEAVDCLIQARIMPNFCREAKALVGKTWPETKQPGAEGAQRNQNER